MLEALQQGEVVMVGQLVANKLIPMMEVYGFVPMKETDGYLDFNMQDMRIVANRVVVKPHEEKPDCFGGISTPRVQVYPIYKKIEINDKESKLPLRFLRVTALEGDRYYNAYQSKGEKAGYIKASNVVQEKSEDGTLTLYYQLTKGEIVLREGIGMPIKCVAPCFMVICRRINTVTGYMTYELYSAEDLFPITESAEHETL